MDQTSFIKEYAFLISLVLIVLVTMVGAFLRRRSRDKCLRDFSDNPLTLKQTGGKTIWEKLRIEHTGLELLYAETKTDAKGHAESSFILYKNEFSSVQALVRFHDDLSEADQVARERDIQKTYQPGWVARSRRRFVNLFKTIRDSMMEVVNLFMAQAKKAGPAGAVLSGQDKHVEIFGILKEYTAEFIEIMDVDYATTEQPNPRKADLVVLRKYGVIRHLGKR